MQLSSVARTRITVCYLLLYVPVFLFITLARGCDDNRDAMVGAAWRGNATEINFLIAIGVSPSRVGWEEHLTPLGMAAREGHTEIVALLLRKGARVNEQDDHRETALTIARREHYPAIVQLLKNAGGHE